MSLAAQIEEALGRHIGAPQTISELAAAIPDHAAEEIERVCYLLRSGGRLGRNGAGAPDRPFKFYLKRWLEPRGR